MIKRKTKSIFFSSLVMIGAMIVLVCVGLLYQHQNFVVDIDNEYISSEAVLFGLLVIVTIVCVVFCGVAVFCYKKVWNKAVYTIVVLILIFVSLYSFVFMGMSFGVTGAHITVELEEPLVDRWFWCLITFVPLGVYVVSLIIFKKTFGSSVNEL